MAYIGSNPRQIPLIKEKGVGLPVGAIVEFPLNKVSAGFLKTTGEKYNPAAFPALYEVLKSDTLPFRGHDTKLGGVKWFNSRSEIDPDFVPADGQALTNGFSLYPDLLLLVSTGKVPTTNDTKWKSDPTMRGCFTTTTSGNEIRVPDYNGKSEGSLGAIILRGDGKNAANPGVIQAGLVGRHAHNLNLSSNSLGSTLRPSDPEEISTSATRGLHFDSKIFDSIDEIRNLVCNEHRGSRTSMSGSSIGNENRMVNTAGCWGVRVQVSTEFAIKAFDSITSEGLVEVAGLVQESVELRQAVDELNAWPQTGSNDNGTWIKYKDGTLICTHVIPSVPAIDVRDYIPGLKQHLFTWEFPHKFYTAADDSYRVPMTSGNMRDNSTSGFFGGSTMLYTGDTAHGARMVYISPTSKLTAALCTLQAIGRWK